MARKIYHFYKKLFDIDIKNSTFVVVIISILIILVGIYIPQKDLNIYSKASLFDINKKIDNFSGKIIIIEGRKYKLLLIND